MADAIFRLVRAFEKNPRQIAQASFLLRVAIGLLLSEYKFLRPSGWSGLNSWLAIDSSGASASSGDAQASVVTLCKQIRKNRMR